LVKNMSRVGKKLVSVPEGVNLSFEDKVIRVSGPKGETTVSKPDSITIRKKGDGYLIERKDDSKLSRSLHGTVQRILVNAINGVSQGWSRKLELVGAGYRARMDGNSLVLAIGFSHPVKFDPPQGIEFSLEENKIVVSGVDKQKVGKIASEIRAVRPPDPYKAKGVKYEGEHVRRKAGKAAKAGASLK